MKTNQAKILTINMSEVGLRLEINCSVFFTECQEKTGLDLKAPLAKYFKLKREKLEAAEILGTLTKQGKTDLENYKVGEQILTTC